MTMKGIVLFLFISTPALAQNADWLGPYLRSKKVSCTLTETQLNEQVGVFLDRFERQIVNELRARGSEFQSLVAGRDQFEIGTFPNAAIFDLYVFEPITIAIQSFRFHVQTSFLTEGEKVPTAHKGLWFPLAIFDPGAEKVCELRKIALADRKFLPAVDLVFGEPPRVVASRLTEVMDVAESTSTPPPSPPPTITPQEKKPELKKPVRRPRKQPEPPPKAEDPPPKADECAGDISPWKRMICGVTGGRSG